MADTTTEQLKELKEKIELIELNQNQHALILKAHLDALKDQVASQYALGVAQAQLPFAELQGIKAGIDGLKLPTGKQGTISVVVGTKDAALLRSKKPLVKLLDKIACDFVELCSKDTILLTEAQYELAHTATFILEQIKNETETVKQAIAKLEPTPSSAIAASFPVIIAGMYTLGFAFDAVNSLSKLFRTDRKIEVFNADDEAMQLLVALLECKNKKFTTKPVLLDHQANTQATELLEVLTALGTQVQRANHVIDKRTTEKTVDEQTLLLKAGVERAVSLIDSLHLAKKPEAFWSQVAGQLIKTKMKGKQRLFIQVKANMVQVADSREWKSDHLRAIGEVQVAYRLLNVDDSLAACGIFLRCSNIEDVQIEKPDGYDFSGSIDKGQPSGRVNNDANQQPSHTELQVPLTWGKRFQVRIIDAWDYLQWRLGRRRRA